MEFVLNSAQLLTFLYYFCTILTILFYFFLKVDRYVFLYSHNNTDTIVQVSKAISKKTDLPYSEYILFLLEKRLGFEVMFFINPLLYSS